MNDTMLGCLYCGETMPNPSAEIKEKFGDEAFRCCDRTMTTLDCSNLYKLVKGLETLKTNIEQEIIKDLL